MLFIKLNPYSVFISIMLNIWRMDHNVSPQVKARWRLIACIYILIADEITGQISPQSKPVDLGGVCVCLEADQSAHLLIIVIVH